MKGRVYKSTGSWYTVHTENGQQIDCRIKGKFRLDELKTTNPIAVGDWVNIEMETDTDVETGIITDILERHNYIIRQSPRKRWQRQIIAANIDQAILLITFSKPRTSLGFIGRFLVTAEMYHIPSILVFNKQDIYRKKDLKKYEEVSVIYEKLGYPCLLISGQTGYQVDQLKELMKDKTSLVSGHSGVGKSTLINHICPDLDLATKQVSKYSDKGVHTTTHATMYDLDFGGRIIDTPGIKEFGLVYLEPEEVGHYFREIKPLVPECQFNNCLHKTEPGCAVKAAVENDDIEWERYRNYLSILDEIEQVNYWERDK